MDHVSPFSSQQAESIARILAETNEGLSGTQIAHLLQECRMADPTPDMTKWKRLFNAFAEAQNRNQVGNHILMVVKRAMDPVNYTGAPQKFSKRRDALNAVLAFSGYQVSEDGTIRRSSKAANLDEALNRAGRLHAALVTRGVHADVLCYCRAELLQKNYFHAVLEAVKSIAVKIRNLSGLQSDGAELVQAAFGLPKDGSSPVLTVNELKSDTDRGEQRGFVNLLIGLFGTIRNPLAHNPKVEWPMEEDDALDILTLASLIHRKIDKARKV